MLNFCAKLIFITCPTVSRLKACSPSLAYCTFIHTRIKKERGVLLLGNSITFASRFFRKSKINFSSLGFKPYIKSHEYYIVSCDYIVLITWHGRHHSPFTSLSPFGIASLESLRMTVEREGKEESERGSPLFGTLPPFLLWDPVCTPHPRPCGTYQPFLLGSHLPM